MGLKQLEWHAGAEGRWVARIAIPYDTNPTRTKYQRFADINVFDWIGYIERRKQKGRVPVMFTPVHYGAETLWFDSVEAAKLHVEAIFALDND